VATGHKLTVSEDSAAGSGASVNDVLDQSTVLVSPESGVLYAYRPSQNMMVKLDVSAMNAAILKDTDKHLDKTGAVKIQAASAKTAAFPGVLLVVALVAAVAVVIGVLLILVRLVRRSRRGSAENDGSVPGAGSDEAGTGKADSDDSGSNEPDFSDFME
jgi:RNA-binding protein YhbY